MSDEPRAVVREIDGQLVLDDPVALAAIRAVKKINCRVTFEDNADRVAYFKLRVEDLQLAAHDVVIVILNVDDVHGGPIAEKLMPGHDWSQYRDAGMIPFARGLAEREGVQGILELMDEDAAAKLEHLTGLAVVVVDHEVAEIFSADD